MGSFIFAMSIIAFLFGFILGKRSMARYSNDALELAARYRIENDQMIDRLTELEDELMDASDEKDKF